MLHFNTIKTYTSAIIDLFSQISLESTDSNGNVITSQIPIVYSNKEKSYSLENIANPEFINGNVNTLPKSSVTFTGLSKDDNRALNRFTKTNKYRNNENVDFAFNSVPYTFEFEVHTLCRGMTSVCNIIEQVAPKFNPLVFIDVHDVENLSEPTRIPMHLTGISFDSVDAFSEFSSNIFTITFSLTIDGSLYQPLKSLRRVLEYKEQLNIGNDNPIEIKGFDNIVIEDVNNDYVINGFNCLELKRGRNTVKVDYTVNLDDCLNFEWGITRGKGEIISQNRNSCIVNAQSKKIEIECIITNGKNVKSISRTFNVV